ncbi:MAG: YceI family protein [Dehalococcoidia bacterium]|nr:YceI family protein [Dehalococcoidia bacterium]
MVGAAVVAVSAIVGGVMVMAGGSDPATVSLESAVASVGTASSSGTSSTSSTSGSATSGLEGTWSVVGGGASFVGYRVEEELAGIGATTAVGRTTAVTGTLAFDGSQITAVDLDADVSQLQSDQSRRDMALRQQALETSKYPTASFELTSPIKLDSIPSEGTVIKATATGVLNVHGVERTVTIPLEGQLTSGRVVVVGTTEIAFADYGIAQPRAAAVLSVADKATLEIQLAFERQNA